MIVTLTPNPSIDRTISVDRLSRGTVQRAHEVRLDPGGKGLNVSRALVRNGHASIAVLPTGGHSGCLMADLLAEAGVQARPVHIGHGIRTNVAIVEPDGTTTKINEPGPALTRTDCLMMFDEVRAAFGGVQGWVVGSGSLPPGVLDEFYAELVSVARELQVKVAIDSSGSALSAAMLAAPDLVKPNREELAEVLGRELTTLGAVQQASEELVGSGIGQVLVSLGRDGALLVSEGGIWHARAEVDSPRSTVGAGDALLAGFLAGMESGLSEPEALGQAVAFGSAAVARPGSEMPAPEQVDSVRVRLLDRVDQGLQLSD